MSRKSPIWNSNNHPRGSYQRLLAAWNTDKGHKHPMVRTPIESMRWSGFSPCGLIQICVIDQTVIKFYLYSEALNLLYLARIWILLQRRTLDSNKYNFPERASLGASIADAPTRSRPWVSALILKKLREAQLLAFPPLRNSCSSAQSSSSTFLRANPEGSPFFVPTPWTAPSKLKWLLI